MIDQAIIDDTVQKLKAAFEAAYRMRCQSYVGSGLAGKFESLFKTESALEESIGELARESFIKGQWVKWTLPEENL